MAQNHKNCIKAVQAASGDTLSEAEAWALIERMGRRKLALDADAKIDDINAKLIELARVDAEAEKIKAALARKHAALSAMRFNERLGHVDALLADGVPYDAAFRSMLVGTTYNAPGSRASVARMKVAYEGRWLGQYTTARLQREVPHWQRLNRDRQFQGDVVREMYQINREAGTPGVTKNPDALKVAKIFADATERARQDMNRNGAAIGKLDGWAGPQRHNTVKAREAGKDAWVSETSDLLALERTFPDLTPDEAREVLGQIWENIAVGRLPDEVGATKGRRVPANVAAALSKSRVLHFKDADAWLAYNDRYGEGHVFDGVVSHLRHSAMTAAQMQVLGPNPQATMDRLLRHYERLARRDERLTPERRASMGDALANGRDPTKGGAISDAFAETSGMTLIASNVTAARYMSNYRAVQGMAKLGAAVFSSFPDLMTRAGAMKYQGKGLLHSSFDQISDLMRGRGSAEQKEISFQLGEGFDGLLDMMVGPYWSEDGPMGTMHKLQNNFFKLSGLTWWTDAMKAAQGRMISNWMARNAAKSFDKLDAGYRAVMRQQGILPAEWDAIRAHGVFEIGDGRQYITPDQVAAIPDAVIAGLASERLANAKSDVAKVRVIADARTSLELKLHGFVADEVGFGMVEPDEATRRFLLRGTRPGTVSGEVLRLIAQFKGFPIAFTQRVIGRGVYGAVGETAMERSLHRVRHLGTLFVGMTIAGYGSLVAKDMLRGFGPRDPSDYRTWMAAAIQGGGAGLYGDFLFGQVNRFGSGILESAAGPGIGAAADFITLGMKLRGGDASAADALNFALQNTPFINLWWSRPALDFLILNELRNTLSPGFLARQATTRRQDYGQTRWHEPMAADFF